jgi:hypothetical protein
MGVSTYDRSHFVLILPLAIFQQDKGKGTAPFPFSHIIPQQRTEEGIMPFFVKKSLIFVIFVLGTILKVCLPIGPSIQYRKK